MDRREFTEEGRKEYEETVKEIKQHYNGKVPMAIYAMLGSAYFDLKWTKPVSEKSTTDSTTEDKPKVIDQWMCR